KAPLALLLVLDRGDRYAAERRQLGERRAVPRRQLHHAVVREAEPVTQTAKGRGTLPQQILQANGGDARGILPGEIEPERVDGRPLPTVAADLHLRDAAAKVDEAARRPAHHVDQPRLGAVGEDPVGVHDDDRTVADVQALATAAPSVVPRAEEALDIGG